MKYKFVLDTNCIIDLEESRKDAKYIKALIKSWKNGNLDLAVVAVSASENQKEGSISRNFSVFEKKLKNVGLEGTKHLLPLAISDFFYWDHAILSGPEMKTLLNKIQNILFPDMRANPSDNFDTNSTWRNNICDVLVAWSCIYHNWDYLITRDNNFHNNKQELINLGLIDVFRPEEASRLI